jgi:hypothetical protein
MHKHNPHVHNLNGMTNHRLQMWKNKKNWRLKRRYWWHPNDPIGLDSRVPLSENLDDHTQKKNKKQKTNRSARICIRRYCYNAALKSLNSKLCCTVSALQYFLKWIPWMASWHRAHSDECFIQLLISRLPRFPCWKQMGFKTVTQLADTGSFFFFFTCIVYGTNQVTTFVPQIFRNPADN